MMVALSRIETTRAPTDWCRRNPPPGFGPLPSRKTHKPTDSIYRATVIRSLDDSLIFDIDWNVRETLLGRGIANAVIMNLKSREGERRPRTDYLEKVQKNMDPEIRARCVDWLIFSSYQLWLSSDTLHLAIGCLDRYLSGNEVDQERLRFVGLTCLMIASKYHEVGRPQIDFDAYDCLMKGEYSNTDFVKMETCILNYLEYDVAIPTVWSFLERFICAAQGGERTPLKSLNTVATFLAETSLVSCRMLQFMPSVIAASCVFVARYILCPWKRPWNATLHYYTGYQPSDLRACVVTLPGFFFKDCLSKTTPIIMNKYSQWTYEYVALKQFPSYIPPEFFEN